MEVIWQLNLILHQVMLWRRCTYSLHPVRFLQIWGDCESPECYQKAYMTWRVVDNFLREAHNAWFVLPIHILPIHIRNLLIKFIIHICIGSCEFNHLSRSLIRILLSNSREYLIIHQVVLWRWRPLSFHHVSFLKPLWFESGKWTASSRCYLLLQDFCLYI